MKNEELDALPPSDGDEVLAGLDEETSDKADESESTSTEKLKPEPRTVKKTTTARRGRSK